MNGDTQQTRRHLIQIAPAIAGMSAVAGCLRLDTNDESSSGNGGGSSADSSGNDQDQSSDDTQDNTGSEPDESESSSSSNDEDATEEMNMRIMDQAETFVSNNDANLYEGQLEDRTLEGKVTIRTGAGDNGFSFNPSGVVVSTGTVVTFEWTGNGGAHNVVSEDNSDYQFESELTDDTGYTLDVIADTPGTMLYVCVPHRAQGMYGAVAVIEGSV